MKFRKMIEEDLALCSEIFARTFSQAPWNENWNTDNAMERIYHFYKSRGFFGVVAEENGLAGFVLGNAEPYCSGSIFYLREMCIESIYQNKGIGGKLLAYLEKTLQVNGVNSIYLLTEINIPVSQFYKKRGYNIDENTGSFSKSISS